MAIREREHPAMATSIYTANIHAMTACRNICRCGPGRIARLSRAHRGSPAAGFG